MIKHNTPIFHGDQHITIIMSTTIMPTDLVHNIPGIQTNLFLQRASWAPKAK